MLALSPHETAELVAKVSGAILGIFGVIAGIAKFVRWVGANVSSFVDEKILPPINRLSASVDELAGRTHETTTAFKEFAETQQETNLNTARAIAHIRGTLGIEEE